MISDHVFCRTKVHDEMAVSNGLEIFGFWERPHSRKLRQHLLDDAEAAPNWSRISRPMANLATAGT
jgi:hypothetical protein